MSIDISIEENKAVSIELRRSKNAKRMSLRADVHGIWVVAPTNQSIETIRDFVRSMSGRISRTYEYYLRIKEKIGGEFQRDTLLFLGTRYKIRITRDRQQEYAVVSDNLKQITFHVKDKRRYKRYLHTWYKKQTRKILDERLSITSTRLCLSYAKFSIKPLRSRWGSCSKNGNLSFNHLLAMLPLHIIDYIIVHELIHLVEFNHSQNFWRNVESAIPDYKDRRKWLRAHVILIRID